MRPAWLVAAVALATFLVWRRRRLHRPLLALGALTVVAMAVHSTGVLELPSLDSALRSLGQALGPWTYLLVAVASFSEAAAFLGLVLPGETTIVVGGVIAGQGQIDIVVLIAVAWSAAFTGDICGYWLGRKLGRPFLLRHGSRFGVTEDRVRMVESLFARHGGKTIFVGRFVGLVRSLAPFLAGASRMPLGRFVPYDVLGSGLQTTLLCLLGFVFWRSIDRVLEIARQGTVAFSLTIATLVAIVLLVRWLRVVENRRRVHDWIEAHDDQVAVRGMVAGGRRLRAPARWLADRLTPGGMGLESTSLLAGASVAGYVFFGYVVVFDDGAPTLGDRRSLAVADLLRTDWLDALAAAITFLGSPAVVTPAVLAVCAWLVLRRERLEAAVLLLGLAVVASAAWFAQGSVARVPLGDDPGVYPASRAALATTWVALAVAVRRVLPRWTHKAALLGVATAVTVAVCLSLVYLGERWFSDVAGGAALGLLVYCAIGFVALAVFTRQSRAGRRGSIAEDVRASAGQRKP